jgi:ribosome biogenesis ATPase
MLRPGRLETPLFVGLPQPRERVEILRALIKKTPIDPSLAEFAADERCQNFSGADLSSLLRKAGQHTLKRGSEVVELQDFEAVIAHMRASVGDYSRFLKMRKRFEGNALLE